MASATTELLNSTSLTMLNSGSWGIRPTAAERRAGRFLRAPDHDAGTGGGDAGADAGGDDGANGADAEAGKGADAGSDAGGDDDGSLMGDAGKKKADGSDHDTDGDKGDDDADKSKSKDDDAEALPEKYELTPPDGFEINDEIIAELDPVLRDLKLNNDQANKLMPLAGSFAERIMKQQNDAFAEQASNWAKEAKADPEIGKGNWKETEAFVAKALDEFGAGEGSEFRQLLDNTKLGNHPAMIRMFRQIGERLTGDTQFVRSDAGAQVKRSREEVLYGTAE